MIKFKKKWKKAFFAGFGTLGFVLGIIFLVEWVVSLIFGEI
jgi:hypothetical protein